MSHYHNTCPACGEVEQCRCPGPKKEMRVLCRVCSTKVPPPDTCREDRMRSLVLAMAAYMGKAAHLRTDVAFEEEWLRVARELAGDP